MKIIDLAGPLYEGMWSYEPPYPKFKMVEIPTPDWVSYKVWQEEFVGLCSQTGTYIQTPAHLLGFEKSYALNQVPLEKLFMLESRVIKLDWEKLDRKDGRPFISKEDLVSSGFDEDLKKEKALIIATGWGKNWKESYYFDEAPFFKKEAMRWIISKNPFLLCGDSPLWDNLKNPESFFAEYFGANILMLGPCINLEKIEGDRVKIIALPLKFEGNNGGSPCRPVAVID